MTPCSSDSFLLGERNTFGAGHGSDSDAHDGVIGDGSQLSKASLEHEEGRVLAAIAGCREAVLPSHLGGGNEVRGFRSSPARDYPLRIAVDFIYTLSADSVYSEGGKGKAGVPPRVSADSGACTAL